jgi:hypothetical protein
VQYAGDIPPPQNTLYASFVTSTIASGTIVYVRERGGEDGERGEGREVERK